MPDIGLFVYAIACLGSNIVYVFTSYGAVAAVSQTVHSGGALVICKCAAGTSFTTATVVVAAATTPLVRLVYYPIRYLLFTSRGQKSDLFKKRIYM